MTYCRHCYVEAVVINRPEGSVIGRGKVPTHVHAKDRAGKRFQNQCPRWNLFPEDLTEEKVDW